MGWSRKWEGGRVWLDAKGRETYVIRKRINGHLYSISTRCHRSKEALDHLRRFEMDPDAYDPSGGYRQEIILNTELVESFLHWCRDERHNSRDWIRKKQLHLAWWSEKLGGRDLRKVTLRDHFAPALEGTPSRKHKIEIIKALYAWLRQERHDLTAAEDPTYGALAVPQGRPEQWVTPKVIPRADYEKVLSQLAPFYRDCLIVLGGTGWHVSELHRFASSGIVAPLPSTASKANDAAALLICPQRKSGEMQRTPVSSDVEVSARRVRAHGSFSDSKFREALTCACKVADVKPISPGRFRHSVATWAIEAGADPAAVAAFLGHKSPATTKRFYATNAVVPKVPTMR